MLLNFIKVALVEKFIINIDVIYHGFGKLPFREILFTILQESDTVIGD